MPPPPLASQNNLSVTVNTDNVNIHGSNLNALERICEKSPHIAEQILRSTDELTKYDYKRYRVAAIMAGGIAIAIIGCAATVIVNSGFWAGIAFFLACVAVSAIVGAVFTGKTQDLSWTIGFVGKKPPADDGDQAA